MARTPAEFLGSDIYGWLDPGHKAEDDVEFVKKGHATELIKRSS